MDEIIDYRNEFKTNVTKYEKLTNSKYIKLIYSIEKEILDSLFEEINAKNKFVMDFACGSGRWTEYLENVFEETVGVDVSEEMLYVAKTKCSCTKFIHSDITSDNVNNQLKHEMFDVITAFRFYKNAEQNLREAVTNKISMYLKKDGYFIFDLHLNSNSIMGIFAKTIRFLRLEKILKLNKLAIRTISLQDIKEIFEGSDLVIVDYYGMGLLPSRSNYLILPYNLLFKIESYFTKNKLLRNYSYNLLIIARKK
jgi:SAM-dependent methyltransferase